MNNVINEINKNMDNMNEIIKNNKYIWLLTDIIVYSNYKLNAFTMKLEIKNNKLIIHKKLEHKYAGDFVRRYDGIVTLINKTLKKHKIKNTLLYIYVGDEYLYRFKNLPIYVLAKPINKLGLLFPDQTYIDIEPENITNKLKSKPKDINKIKDININPKDKIPELYFIGQNIALNGTKLNIRKELSLLDKPINVNITGFKPMNYFSNYKYLLNLSGAVPWSFRFKFLFIMYSLVINIQTINDDYTDGKWINIIDPLFEKDKDYIEIEFHIRNNDTPDNIKKNIRKLQLQLLDTMDYYENNPDEYNKIVLNGYNKSKELNIDNVLNLINICCNGLLSGKLPLPMIRPLGAFINKGYSAQVYEYNNKYVLKIIKDIIGRQENYNELLIYSIIEKSQYKNNFLKLKTAWRNDSKTYYLIEKADISLKEMDYKDINWNQVYSNILECINNLHSLNIYHGDIQPINIMFSIKKNKYYLIDFGASIIVNNTEWLNNDYEMFKEVPNSYKIKFLKEKDNLSLNDLIKQISNKDLNRLKKEIAYIKDIGEFNRFLYHKIGHLYIKQKKLYINDYENKLFYGAP